MTSSFAVPPTCPCWPRTRAAGFCLACGKGLPRHLDGRIRWTPLLPKHLDVPCAGCGTSALLPDVYQPEKYAPPALATPALPGRITCYIAAALVWAAAAMVLVEFLWLAGVVVVVWLFTRRLAVQENQTQWVADFLTWRASAHCASCGIRQQVTESDIANALAKRARERAREEAAAEALRVAEQQRVQHERDERERQALEVRLAQLARLEAERERERLEQQRLEDLWRLNVKHFREADRQRHKSSAKPTPALRADPGRRHVYCETCGIHHNWPACG